MNNRSKINLYCQKKKVNQPNFQLIKKEGDDHRPSFTVCCTFEGKSEEGTGSNRKVADEDAALKIVNLFQIDQYLKSAEEKEITYSIESYNAPLKDIWNTGENKEYKLTLKQKDQNTIKYKNFIVKIIGVACGFAADQIPKESGARCPKGDESVLE